MKIQLIILVFALLPFTTQAQLNGLLNKVKNKTTQKTNQRIDGKLDKTIDKTLDDLEGKPTAKNNSAAVPDAEPGTKSEGVISISKYDFIPGEKMLYAEDFAQESISELPTGWNTNGSGEVVTLQNLPNKWLRLHKSFVYLTSNASEFGENYTLEFDLILQLKNNGWSFPAFYWGVFSSGDLTTTDNALLKEYSRNASVTATIQPGAASESRIKLESKADNKSYFTGSDKEYKELQQYFGKPVHVSVQVQKERIRIWINQVKAFDAPKAVPLDHKMNQLFFKVSHTNYAEEDYGIYISNIKIATGLPDTRHKLMEEGKFSTTGILFDNNSAIIKPESHGIIKEIAAVLKENPTVKIRITGYTSSDGDDNSNLELSKNRAAAVKEALVKEYGIDQASMETEGKGETQPAADNVTKEGRAANRRVEFTKI